MAEQGTRKVREGTVTSTAMDKTIAVEVNRLMRHSRYGRVVRTSTRYKAHDERNECGVGDRVRIMETRPLSKTKRWRLVSVVEKAK